jgi:hypothetical protein
MLCREFRELDPPTVVRVCVNNLRLSLAVTVGTDRHGLDWCPWTSWFCWGRRKLLWRLARVFRGRIAGLWGVARALCAGGRPQHQRTRLDAFAGAGVLTGCDDQNVAGEDTPSNEDRVVRRLRRSTRRYRPSCSCQVVVDSGHSSCPWWSAFPSRP